VRGAAGSDGVHRRLDRYDHGCGRPDGHRHRRPPPGVTKDPSLSDDPEYWLTHRLRRQPRLHRHERGPRRDPPPRAPHPLPDALSAGAHCPGVPRQVGSAVALQLDAGMRLGLQSVLCSRRDTVCPSCGCGSLYTAAGHPAGDESHRAEERGTASTQSPPEPAYTYSCAASRVWPGGRPGYCPHAGIGGRCPGIRRCAGRALPPGSDRHVRKACAPPATERGEPDSPVLSDQRYEHQRVDLFPARPQLRNVRCPTGHSGSTMRG
jgi:hypothetical protein